MKKKFAIAAIFLMTYLVFLIATLPSTVVLKQVTLPKDIVLSGVQGTLWHTRIEQVTVSKTIVQKVNAKLSFWSLFSLTPKVDITFGDPLLSGAEGQLVLSVASEEMTINNLSIFIKANEIAQQLPLPIPLSAQGDVSINISEASIDLQKSQCVTAEGDMTWSKSRVIALEKNIKLGKFNADIACENGVLAFVLSPKNNLGITFSAYARKGGKISGKGYLKPGNKFPLELESALPFLGRKDKQGRYRLSF